jgi:hypothetical protein
MQKSNNGSQVVKVVFFVCSGANASLEDKLIEFPGV